MQLGDEGARETMRILRRWALATRKETIACCRPAIALLNSLSGPNGLAGLSPTPGALQGKWEAGGSAWRKVPA